MQTVAETPSFIRQIERIMSDDERLEAIAFLSENPLAGDLIPGGSGVRKVRFSASGRGKRGGARIVYYFYDETMPIYALAAYAKNERATLSDEGLKAIAKLVAALKAEARK